VNEAARLARPYGSLHCQRAELNGGGLRARARLRLPGRGHEHDLSPVPVGGCPVRLRSAMVEPAYRGGTRHLRRPPVHAIAASAQGRGMCAAEPGVQIVFDGWNGRDLARYRQRLAAGAHARLRLRADRRPLAPSWRPFWPAQLRHPAAMAGALRPTGGVGGTSARGRDQCFAGQCADLLPARGAR
jgi:hypothetical protein